MRAFLRYMCALVALTGASVAAADTYTFDKTEADWNASSSWYPPNGPPGADDHAIILDGQTCKVQASDADVGHFTINSGGTIKIYNGRTLEIHDAANASTINGILVLDTAAVSGAATLTWDLASPVELVGSGYIDARRPGSSGTPTRPSFRFERNSVIATADAAVSIDWPLLSGAAYQDLVVQGNIFYSVGGAVVLDATSAAGPVIWGFIGYNVYRSCPTALSANILDTTEGDRTAFSSDPFQNLAVEDYRNTVAVAGAGNLHYLARIGGRVAAAGNAFKNQLAAGAVERQTP